MTRRDLMKLAGAAGLGLAARPGAFAQQRKSELRAGVAAPRFPNGFYWGVATSAYQIEGAWNEDAKGKSPSGIPTPTRPATSRTGPPATSPTTTTTGTKRTWHLCGRLERRHTGSPSPGRGSSRTALASRIRRASFYSRLVDELLANGIEPFPTLYHWDLPQALQDKNGGWQSRDTARAFADYAGSMAEQLSDRVKHFFTLNEMHSFVDIGYRGHDVAVGGKTVTLEIAPGLKLPPAELNQVRHHAVLAHGLAVQAIRAQGRQGTKCGPAESITTPVPLIESPEHIKAAEAATREMNAAYLTVMLEGKYMDAYLEAAGNAAPKFTDDDLKIISAPVDFVGINVYRPTVYVLASDEAPGYQAVPFNASHPKMFSSWHVLGPEVIYWAPKFVQSLWKAKEIYIAENGCAADDELAEDGNVYDTDRIMFLRNYLTQLQRATADGVPVKGYFLWSMMDNFEWSAGYGNRFGIVYVDFKTQKRTPKLSASFFREVAARNEVV
jgi:beta-glucosidase